MGSVYIVDDVFSGAGMVIAEQSEGYIPVSQISSEQRFRSLPVAASPDLLLSNIIDFLFS